MVQVFIKTDYQLRKDTICPQCTHSFEYIEVNPFRNLHNQIYFKFHVMQSSVAVLYSTKMQTCCKMLSKWSSAVWIYNSFCRGYTIYNCNFLFQSVWLFVCLFMFSNIQPDLRAYAYFPSPSLVYGYSGESSPAQIETNTTHPHTNYLQICETSNFNIEITP